MSDNRLFRNMQHFETGCPMSSRLDIEAWVRGVSSTHLVSSSPKKKKTVAKREDLALLDPKIQFRAFQEAEDWGIEFSQAIKDLWSRCHASLL